jgi:asparagine synthase (glutamine-hydrolysing)
MCGIAGFVNRDGFPADRDLLSRMTATLAHRGPDAEGLYVDGPVGLGHRRLSIIDLEGGGQPMANEDETVWVSYNGEIYNEPELRAALQARGHTFRTACDTECLVHLYEEHGPDFVRHLNGMFALAIWDHRRSRLVLARDRMGQKPLFYARTPGGGLVFGSEAKAVLIHPEVGRRLDRDGLARYLFYEYIPAPGSIWSGLSQLPRAHVLVWEAGRTSSARYWEAPVPAGAAPDFESAAEQLWSDFRAAVARHRRSDVPLGVFLSGGIDSSCIAAALSELESAHRVRTFSIGFDDPSFDESEPARAVADYLGTDHHEHIFAASTVLEMLPEVVTWLDEPLGDASLLPTHLLSRFARNEVTVALGGEGGDELLAGYPTFAAELGSRVYRRLPRRARQLAEAMVSSLPVRHGNLSFDFKVKQFLRGAAEVPSLAHQRWMSAFDGAEIRALLADPPAIDVEVEHLQRSQGLAKGADRLARSLALYQDTYLPGDALNKVDRASMACGLEVRAPLLDAALVESIQRLPSRYKFARGRTKRILKRAAAGRLPSSILRRPKRGFCVPVARWLRGPLGPLLDDLLGPDRLTRQGLFRPEEVARRIREHREGARDHRKPLWTLLMFQLWYSHWVDHLG